MYNIIVAEIEKSSIVCEIGLSHEGSLGFTFAFIEACSKSGADFVKFQMHLAEFESSGKEEFRTNFSLQDLTRWDYWKRTSFKISQWKQIIEHCKKNNIEPQISVFSVAALNICLELGVNYIKLGSGDFTNPELAEAILVQSKSNQELNLVLSSGMATWEEVEMVARRFDNLRKSNKLVILQCTSMYPTPLNLVGLDSMIRIRDELGIRSGLSDHSEGLTASMAAIVLGAHYIERHIVFDKRMFGPDTQSSIDFRELSLLTNFRDQMNVLSIPTDKDKVARSLTKYRSLFGRSLALKDSLPKGHVVKETDFCLRKPGGYLGWEDRGYFLGKSLIRAYSNTELLDRSFV